MKKYEKIEKSAPLTERLVNLPINTPYLINYEDYTIPAVRTTVTRLRNQGYEFGATTKGVERGNILVTRKS